MACWRYREQLSLRLMANTPWNASWHLRAELARVSEMLAGLLRRQRERGRTPVADAVQGFVIEDGEAEGLAAELAAAWSGPSTHAAAARCRSTQRGEVAVRADQGAAQGAVLPLRHAARAFDLLPEEYNALLLALAVEMDPRFGRLVAYLNDHVGRTRPTVGLALTLAPPEADGPPLSPIAFCERPLVRDGLLELEGEGPLPGLSLRLPRAMFRRLSEDSLPGPDSADLPLFLPEPGLLDRLELEGPVRDGLRVWAE